MVSTSGGANFVEGSDLAMKSCLYEMTIMHERRSPILRRFEHKVFMFYLDLDEVDALAQKSWLFGHNQGKIYNYCERDHIGEVRIFLEKHGVNNQVKSIRLLTNVRTWGYVFNPVSFYFCFDAQGKPVAVVVEIGNTFNELKYFFLGHPRQEENVFKDQQTKYYYISPFTDLDNQLDFDIHVPGEQLKIGIDVLKGGKPFFFSSMLGLRKEFSERQLWWYTVTMPLMTLKVIFLIHWHAAVLHFKHHVAYHPKEESPDKQKDVARFREVVHP